MKYSAKCPVCNKYIDFDEEIGVQEMILCPFCRILLEFINAIPPTFDQFPTYDKKDLPSGLALYKTVVRSENGANKNRFASPG